MESQGKSAKTWASSGTIWQRQRSAAESQAQSSPNALHGQLEGLRSPRRDERQLVFLGARRIVMELVDVRVEEIALVTV
jgi:hypothetical protein